MFDPHADPHGERTVRSQGAKSAADLILLEKKGRKALEYKDWKAPNQLVRLSLIHISQDAGVPLSSGRSADQHPPAYLLSLIHI